MTDTDTDTDALFDSGTSDDAAVPPDLSGGTQTVSATPGSDVNNASQMGGKLNKVSAIDVINTSSGALTGFPTIGGVDLNTPGTVNDTATTTKFQCRLVVQVKFTLSGVSANDVALTRMIVRTATVTIDGAPKQVTKMSPTGGPTNDGPSQVTIIRPSDTVIAVSDDPGFAGGGDKIFPITYHASFDVYAFDLTAKTLYAKVSFVVDIAKQTPTDASPTVTLSSVTKTIF